MAHVIRNFDALALSGLRSDALSIAEAGFTALDIHAALGRFLQSDEETLRIGGKNYPLADRRIYFVGIGKCAFAAAKSVEKILGAKLSGGVAFDVSEKNQRDITSVETFVGTHPLPSEANVRATDRILEFLGERGKEDLVLMLISGGGSTLLCRNEPPMTCLDESGIFKTLTQSGAAIEEINTVRKHLSLARGGGLAKAAYPAQVVSLIVSDVPGDDIGFIASGPTVRDSSTIEEARRVLETYGIPMENIRLLETPKEERYFERVQNILFLTNKHALEAMRAEAGDRGYQPTVVDDQFSGEARKIGRAIGAKLHEASPGSAFLYAGESTVTLEAVSGKGGRNQEMALAALADMREGELLLPFASDGHDNSDAAGAISDSLSRAHAEEKQIPIAEYLGGHRSYDFFQATGDALSTEYTGTNVSDLIIALKK